MFEYIPLNALRTFIVAARLENFKQAGEVMSVTPTAIGAQIKVLEQYLDTELFVRKHRHVKLNRVGQRLLDRVSPSFENLSHAVLQIKTEKKRPVLTIGTGALLASEWLMPQLDNFAEHHPSIDICLRYRPTQDSNNISSCDAIISWQSEELPGMISKELFKVPVAPAASPSLLKKMGTLTSPEDLLRFPLIHDTTTTSWLHWFESLGIFDSRSTHGISIQHGNVQVQAAIQSKGIILAILPFIQDDLATGRLALPFDRKYIQTGHFKLIYPPEMKTYAPLIAFQSWVFEEGCHLFDNL